MTGDTVVPTDTAPATGAAASPTRPRAILLAYSCGPGAGSESGVGWTWTRAAAEFADVILITHSTRFRPGIESTIAELELPITAEFVDVPKWLVAVLRGKLLGMVKYCIWQARAARVLRRYEARQRIDVVHHVTWATDSLPSALLASRAPVRVWGPIGGSTRTRPGLYRYLTIRGKVGELFRDFMNGTLRAISGARLARHATLLVALNPDVQARWKAGPTPIVMASNIALDKTELALGAPTATGRGDHGPRLALFVGRLIPWKGLLLAVQSLRYAPSWKLVVLGEGPDRARAEALAIRLGVEDRLEFRGLVPRPEVLDIFRCADAVLFPSFHDSASWAVGEASSLGCPVVCLDVGGPAIQAGRNAHVVPVTPGATLPQRLGARLEELTGRGEPHDDLRSDRISGVLRTWYAGTVSHADGSHADGSHADGSGADGSGADGSGAGRAGPALDARDS